MSLCLPPPVPSPQVQPRDERLTDSARNGCRLPRETTPAAPSGTLLSKVRTGRARPCPPHPAPSGRPLTAPRARAGRSGAEQPPLAPPDPRGREAGVAPVAGASPGRRLQPAPAAAPFPPPPPASAPSFRLPPAPPAAEPPRAAMLPPRRQLAGLAGPGARRAGSSARGPRRP